MSMDQVRAQRAYIDAQDLRREADQNIDHLEGELERWRRIREDAIALGQSALNETADSPAPVDASDSAETPK